MAIAQQTFIADTFSFIKNDLINNIVDPIATTRASNEKFILTAYPQRAVTYPLITLKVPAMSAQRAGMQTTAMDYTVKMEIRIWARNNVEREELTADVLNRLAAIQYLSNGSAQAGLHNVSFEAVTEINEEGQAGIKSKIIVIRYNYYNPS